ncbi:MAG: galactose-1-phosphate uridylyltransferase [Schlesneria sp.]
MPELRKDPMMRRWVVMAPDRAKRPIQTVANPVATGTDFDPFAEGNEATTPPEILAYRSPDSVANGPGWRVRVVPNKYPALQFEPSLETTREGIYEMMNGLGTHEVIIECPHNETNLARLDVDHVREVMAAYRDRMADLKRDRRLVHALIFKNNGILAGASLPHSHSQLIASPVVPIAIWEEIQGAREFFNNQHRSIFAEMIQQELTTGSRIVLDTPGFVAFCPYASRFPYETWILPKEQSSHFENISSKSIDELGHVLKTVLGKQERALDDPPYNYVLHSAPFDQPELPHYRWHFEIFPRLTRVAGFEWGSGFYINPVYPEEAARRLRDSSV